MTHLQAPLVLHARDGGIWSHFNAAQVVFTEDARGKAARHVSGIQMRHPKSERAELGCGMGRYAIAL